MLSRNLTRTLCNACRLNSRAFICVSPFELSRRCAGPSSTPRRHMSTPPPMFKASEISMEEYHALSETTMDNLLEALETILDTLANPNFEVEYSSGVLTLSLGDHGTYVINKQPPNKQIWLSSPFSGPKRYDYSAPADGWYYSRDGRSMGELLEDELRKALGQKVELGLEHISEKRA